MSQASDLKSVLRTHFQWHGARLTFMALFIRALFQVKTVNLAELAVALNPQVDTGSNYRRLQRFFGRYSLDEDSVARFLLKLLPRPSEGYTLSLDRTTWKFGSVWLNLLVLGVCYNGVAIPIVWMPLNKRGNSNTLERIAVLELFISLFGTGCITCLTADREFIGQAWFKYLQTQGIPFRIRIRRNLRVSAANGQTMAASALFEHLAVGQHLCLNQPRTVMGCNLYLIGLRLPNQKWLIIATDQRPETALDDYAKRWQIETLFGVLKSRGFQLEQTHLTDGERLCKLIALLAMAALWAIKVGHWLHQLKPIPLKKHGRLAQSIFRYGLDALRTQFLNPDGSQTTWGKALSFLSCT